MLPRSLSRQACGVHHFKQSPMVSISQRQLFRRICPQLFRSFTLCLWVRKTENDTDFLMVEIKVWNSPLPEWKTMAISETTPQGKWRRWPFKEIELTPGVLRSQIRITKIVSSYEDVLRLRPTFAEKNPRKLIDFRRRQTFVFGGLRLGKRVKAMCRCMSRKPLLF